MKRFVHLLIILLLSFIAIDECYATEDIKLCEFSEEYIAWSKLSDTKKLEVVMPSMCKTEKNDSKKFKSFKYSVIDGTSLPDRYNSRDYNYITDIRNQKTSNSCWTFSSSTVLESLILKNISKEYQFSTRHMDYSTTRNFLDGKVNLYGYNREVNTGGNYYLSSNYFINKYGPILESDMSFTDSYGLIELNEIKNKNILVDVNDIELYESSDLSRCTVTDINKIKNAVYNYGAVGSYVYFDENNQFFDSKNNSLYNSTKSESNHAIAIVGWDDRYSVDNFSASNKPKTSGAWIVQSSWGDMFGDGGLFYVSYEDIQICDMLMIIKDVDFSLEDNLYSLDEYGYNVILDYASNNNDIYSSYGMNIYTKETGKKEKLKEITFASVEGSSFELYLYKGNVYKDNVSVSSMMKIGSGIVNHSGYTTYKIADEILLDSMVTDFSIVIRYESNVSGKLIPLSYKDDYLWKYEVIDEGKSFVSVDGKNWIDLFNPNSNEGLQYEASIKVSTNDIDEDNENAVYWSSSIGGGNTGDDLNKSLYSYLISNGINLDNVTEVIFNNIYQSKKIVSSDIFLDISRDKNGTVMAYVVDNILYIQFDGKLYFNQKSGFLFAQNDKIEYIRGLEYVDTSNVLYMTGMFYENKTLKEIDLSNFNTCNVIDMSYMFVGNKSLNELDLSSFDTSKVTNMYGMLHGLESLEKLNVSNFNTSNVTNMAFMFTKLKSLKELDLSSFDTSNVTDMTCMFSEMWSLLKLNISSFNTSKVTTMNSMFSEMKSLEQLDLSSFDTSNVENMFNMFNGLEKLKELDLSNFNTSKVTDMTQMFSNLFSLTKLDVSSFDTSNVTSMRWMFASLFELEELDVSNFDTSSVINMYGTFVNLWKIKTLDISNFNTSNVTNMSFMFYGLKSIEELDLSSFDTRKVTNMSYMFDGVEKMKSIDVSNFDTSKVTDMSFMFSSMSNLKEIDVSHFDTSNVTNISGMFGHLKLLTKLDLSNFNTSKVTNMSGLFYSTSGLEEIDLSNFNTSNVTDMSNMFAEMTSLKRLDLSNFDTSNVTDMMQMFTFMSSLEELRLDSFDTSKVTNMRRMFDMNENLKLLDISSFDTSNVTDMSDMFSNDYVLEKIYVSEKWNLESVEISENMFRYAYKLKGQNGTGYDENYVDHTYAKIDSINSKGYLSVKILVSSDVYEVGDKYIYIGSNKFDDKNISVTNGKYEVKDNKVYINYNDNLVKEYFIVSISSDNCKIGISSILCDTVFDSSFINVNNANKEIDGEYLNVKLNGDVIKRYYVEKRIYINKNNLIVNNYDSSLNSLKNKIKEYYDGSIKYIHYDNNSKVVNNDILNTGDYIEIHNDKLIDKYNISIKGDLSGDGDVDSLDLATMLNHISGKKELKSAYLEAAYLNGDDDIDSLDLAYLMNHIAGKEGY